MEMDFRFHTIVNMFFLIPGHNGNAGFFKLKFSGQRKKIVFLLIQSKIFCNGQKSIISIEMHDFLIKKQASKAKSKH